MIIKTNKFIRYCITLSPGQEYSTLDPLSHKDWARYWSKNQKPICKNNTQV